MAPPRNTASRRKDPTLRLVRITTMRIPSAMASEPPREFDMTTAAMEEPMITVRPSFNHLEETMARQYQHNGISIEKASATKLLSASMSPYPTASETPP